MKTLPILLLASTMAMAGCGSPPSKGAQPKAGTETALVRSQPNEEDDPIPPMFTLYGLSAEALDGGAVQLADYKGKVTLVVNVASKCGYTRQYKGLQALHTELEDRGFAVLGFPSNEFGGQEPGSPEQIREFCSQKYGVTFPMFSKVVTKSGDSQSPIYAALTTSAGKQPKWNFCKYLVDKNGEVLGFYPSSVAPNSPKLRTAIEAALNE